MKVWLSYRPSYFPAIFIAILIINKMLLEYYYRTGQIEIEGKWTRKGKKNKSMVKIYPFIIFITV